MRVFTPLFDFPSMALKVKNFSRFLIIKIYFTILGNFYLPGCKYRANLGCPIFLF